MSTNVIQTSFAGGELSPTLYARVDLDKYHIGAARLYNFFVDYRGGASNRPGTELVARALSDGISFGSPVRLIPFQFSVIQNYILEFGNFYMRVIKDGALVLETAFTISSISLANPGVVQTTAPHGFSSGDQVFFNISVGMPQINGKEYFAVVTGANTFTLLDWNGTPLNTAGFTAFVTGTVSRVYKITSPYAATDLALIKFTQSADVMTLCHPSYAPRDLTRTSDTNWAFTTVSLGATIAAPTISSVVATGGAGVTTYYSYVVTAVDANGQESVASTPFPLNAAPDIRTTAGSIAIAWGAVTGAVAYNVYKALPLTGNFVPTGALFGFMTSITAGLTAIDGNIVPDFTVGPPTHDNPLLANNPATVTYDQQRKVYAGSNAEPETFWMSKPGQFNNFDISNPIQPSDAITGTLVSRQVNQIKHMVSMPNGLIMLTSGGAWQISGAGGVLSPTSIQATPQAYNGAGDVLPLTINYEIIYVQQKGTIVRDLSYSFYTNIYTGSDLSVLSNHLFSGYTISEWAYAEEPFKIIWAVRSDGSLLSLTYLKDEKIFGWARHQTQGRFKSTATIPEGSEDAVYFVVQRSINGQQANFIERMHTRSMPYGPADAFFVDCAVTTPGSNPAATLNFSGIDGDITVTASAGIWSSGDVGAVIFAAGGIMEIISYTDAQHVTARVSRELTDVDPFLDPPIVWPQASGTWTLFNASTNFSGLSHLDGETVSILADGNVVTPQVVNNGTITLDNAAHKVTVGLGYKAQLQTLYLDTGDPTIQGKRKNIAAMTARVADSRGLQMGPNFDDLTDFKDRDLDTIGQPINLFTGDERMIIGGGYTTEGQLCIQQENPLPATILGVIPEIVVGDQP